MASSFPRHIKIASLVEFEKGYKIANGVVSIARDTQPALIEFFSAVLNFTYSFVKPHEFSIGRRQADGNWDGLIGLLQRGESDMVFFTIATSIERKEAVHFSYPYYVSSVSFLTHKPQPLPKSFAISYPFSGIIWTTFLVFILAYSISFASMRFNSKKQYIRTLFSTIGNVFGQPFTVQMTSRKLKLVFGSWVIAITFLAHAYKALLLSYLLVTPEKGIRTIAELSAAVVDGSVKCMTGKGNYAISALKGSGDASLRTIGTSLEQNSLEYSTDPKKMLEEHGNVAVIYPEFFHRHLRFQYFQSKDSFFPMSVAIPTRKDFCCKEVLDRTLRRMVEAGLYEKILNDIENRFTIDHILKHPAHTEAEHKLMLEDVKGAVVILICGHFLSFMVFIAEILFHEIAKR